MAECCQIQTRKVPKQNIIYRLINREIFGTKQRGAHHSTRLFYLNVFPNFTIVNVEKPPCFLRKFSPNGQYFIAFSADQTSLEVYQYKGCTAAADLLQKCDGEYVGNKINPENDYIRSNIFNRLFQLKYTINVAESNKQLNRECSLFTEDCRYVIVGSAAYIPEDIRPHFYDVYTNNEAVTPNPRLPLEDISLHLVDLEAGKLCDTLNFKVDKIYLSHNQGLYLYKDRLAVLSVQHQTIYIYLVLDGLFVNMRVIGRFCYESDSLFTSVVAASNSTPLRAFRETVTNSLKHRLLVFLYKRAADVSQRTGNPLTLRKFYMHFDQFKELRLWKMQMLDENHLLLKYASEDVVVLKTTESNSQPSLFVVYNIIATDVIAVYENTSKDLLYLLENFTDHFRNAKLNCESQYTCSPSNNIYARSAVERFKQTIISARYGGPTEATRRLLAQLPISAQSYSCTPYLDLSLFSYDDKWISPMERPKGCGEHPIRFYERHSGLLKFKMYAGVLGRSVPVTARRLVAFIFHPTDPFAISVQRTNSDYIVNFHLRNSSVMIYKATAECFRSEAKLSNEYRVCDNISLETIVTEFEIFYYQRFKIYPQLCRRVDQTKCRRSTRSANTVNRSNYNKRNQQSCAARDAQDNRIPSLMPNLEISNIPQKCGNLVRDEPVASLSDINITNEWTEFKNMIMQNICCSNSNVRWEDVKGLNEVKELLKEAIIYPIKYPHLFTDVVEPWRSMLMYGPPGTGKTLLAQAAANESMATFFKVSSSSIINKWRGDTEKLIKVLFELAQHHAPSIIFIDEIDSLTLRRNLHEHEASRRMKSELFLGVDELLRSKSNVFLLATTNTPWDLDEAIVRRFEKQVYVPKPDLEIRKVLLEHFLPRLINHRPAIETRIDYKRMAEMTASYSGCDLKNLCKEVKMNFMREIFLNLELNSTKKHVDLRMKAITDEHMAKILSKFKPRTIYSEDKYTNWKSGYHSDEN